MLAYFTRRLLLTIPVLFGIATLVFALVHLVPGDPAVSMLGEGATGEDVAALRTRLGLDQPLLVQYGHYLSGVVRGDLGTSFRLNTPVARAIQTTSDDELLVEHGALYPALQRLEAQGLISAKWGTSPNNRRARYYTLTKSGRAHLARQSNRWRRLAAAMARVLGPEPERN